MFDLAGKTALVTGATGGIGGEIAKVLAGAGAKVALSGTRQERLEAVAAEIGDNAVVVPGNLSRIGIGQWPDQECRRCAGRSA